MEPRFPFDNPCPYQPAPALAQLRADGPVARVRLPTGDPAWLVTTYAENRQVLGDPRFSRAAAARAEAPRARRIPLDPRAITALDPPEHTRLRRLVAGAFTARRVARLGGFVQSSVDRLLDDLVAAGPPADLVAGFARPLSLAVIARLLGVPPEVHADFRGWTDAYLSVDSHTPDQMRAAVRALRDHLTELVARHRKAAATTDPDGNLLALLVGAVDDGATLDDEDIVSFACTVLVAGYETVAAHLANSVLALLDHPDQWDRLRRQPDRIAEAVEELLRFVAISPSGGTLRVAVADLELGGARVSAGDAVLPATTSANRDPAIFAAANTLDIFRSANQHIAFGYGAHHCLGANLARRELRVALGTLARRLPRLAVAVDRANLAWDTGKLIRGPRCLPVVW